MSTARDPRPPNAAPLSTRKIVFLVIAAAAPLAAMVGTVPLAFALGNGPGFPAMFVAAGVTLLCFSVGYAAMSRRIVNAGGFYTYLSCGLGRPVAVAGGLLAIVAYGAVAIGLAGAFGYFARLVAAAHGLDLPWEVWGAVGIGLTAALAYRRIDLNARVLAVLMVAEISILLVFDLAVLAHDGARALPLDALHPDSVLSGGIGVSLMFAYVSYIGFESAALYGEETRNPRRSVPVATYTSVVVITLFYALTSWIAVGAIGPDRVRQTAGEQLGNLFFALSDQYLNGFATTILQILLCTSLFAALLALHNAANRYLFALGRDRVLPAWLGRPHHRHGSPHRASAVLTGVTVVVMAAAALGGLDPYVDLAAGMLGLGTLGIIVLQAAAALAVVAFFRNRPDRHWWRTGLAPTLGLVGLVAAVVLLVANFPVLTGSQSLVINTLPWLLVLAALLGLGHALWLRGARPEVYESMAAVHLRSVTEEPPLRPPATRAPVGVE
ncbi:APC family permease [Micromonospora maritima]|uniref:APC family permease n=1 Tax=Micromonospora maritima TaxID=986711 RepID=UPI0037A108C1